MRCFLLFENRPQLADDLFSIPWDHHRRIIDKCKDNLNTSSIYCHNHFIPIKSLKGLIFALKVYLSSFREGHVFIAIGLLASKCNTT